MTEVKKISSRCEECKFRKNAERNPKSLIAVLWRWHTRWCPGWKAYQRELSAQEEKTECVS
ncbi:MAG: hypothetical protein K6T65_13690 [Peptococcaceae bacterium]|nr:hypothetical protein [Peptococcaceae bacterium]